MTEPMAVVRVRLYAEDHNLHFKTDEIDNGFSPHDGPRTSYVVTLANPYHRPLLSAKSNRSFNDAARTLLDDMRDLGIRI